MENNNIKKIIAREFIVVSIFTGSLLIGYFANNAYTSNRNSNLNHQINLTKTKINLLRDQFEMELKSNPVFNINLPYILIPLNCKPWDEAWLIELLNNDSKIKYPWEEIEVRLKLINPEFKNTDKKTLYSKLIEQVPSLKLRILDDFGKPIKIARKVLPSPKIEEFKSSDISEKAELVYMTTNGEIKMYSEIVNQYESIPVYSYLIKEPIFKIQNSKLKTLQSIKYNNPSDYCRLIIEANPINQPAFTVQKIYKKRKELKTLNSNIVTPFEKSKNFWCLFWVLFLLLFGMRYFIYSLKWSIATLRN